MLKNHERPMRIRAWNGSHTSTTFAHGNRPKPTLWLAFVAALVSLAVPLLAQDASTKPSELIAALRQRIQADPRQASDWRLLGRALSQVGDPEALAAFRQAVQLDPDNAAAQFDLGQYLLRIQQRDEAIVHLQRCLDLAPQSQYAQDSRASLIALGEVPAAGPVEQVSFETEWLTPPPVAEVIEARTLPRFRYRLEAGALYNSNVELAPISRQLTPGEEGSAQAFLAPELDYLFWDAGDWNAGVLFDGYFNFNESHRSQFNLEHYQPGVYIETLRDGGDIQWVTRLDYNFAYDAFDGSELGTRHAIVGSLSAVTLERTWITYASFDATDFADDGSNPTETSLDGQTYSVGALLVQPRDGAWFSTLRVGGDVQWADLEGSLFRYRSVMLFSEAEADLAWATLILRGAWGYRDYPDFGLSPSRNESIWQGRAELRRYLTRTLYLAGLFQYDRFASENANYDADRYLKGLYVVWHN